MWSILTIFLFVCGVLARKGYGPGEQEWGHVQVREGANMFYWLYYGKSDEAKPENLPTLVMLPGQLYTDSTYENNFGAFGPIDMDNIANEDSPLEYSNILDVDSPVGVGYSYVSNDGFLADSYEQIGMDMVALLKEYYKRYPELKISPLYIYGSGKGATTAVLTAKFLNAAIKSGEIDVELKGLSMAHPDISPVDDYRTLPTALLQFGFIDEDQYEKLNELSADVLKNIESKDKERFNRASQKFYQYIEEKTTVLDFRDVREQLYRRDFVEKDENLVGNFMDTHVKPALALNESLVYKSANVKVLEALSNVIEESMVSSVEELLRNSDVKISVLAGQFNLEPNSLGIARWVKNLKWGGSSAYSSAKRSPFYIENSLEGYYKATDRLKMFWVLRSGSGPVGEKPNAHLKIVQSMLSDKPTDFFSPSEYSSRTDDSPEFRTRPNNTVSQELKNCTSSTILSLVGNSTKHSLVPKPSRRSQFLKNRSAGSVPLQFRTRHTQTIYNVIKNCRPIATVLSAVANKTSIAISKVVNATSSAKNPPSAEGSAPVKLDTSTEKPSEVEDSAGEKEPDGDTAEGISDSEIKPSDSKPEGSSSKDAVSKA